MKKKTSRRALLMSVLSLLLCVSMLIGTTYAWFTDSVTSATNVIEAGNLDVELYYQVEGQDEWTKVTSSTNIFQENALWEPGHTEVVRLKVVNEGTLALKYQLGVNVVDEVGSINKDDEEFKLSDHIKFGIVKGAQTYTREEAIAAVEEKATALKSSYNSGTLSLMPTDDEATAENEKEAIVTMVVYMPTTVDNVANHKTGADQPTILLGIKLLATQFTAEEDSFDELYDKGAWVGGFEVNSEDELRTALENGEKKIVIASDIVTENGFVISGENVKRAASEPIALNLNGHTLTATGNRAYLFHVKGDASVSFENGKMVAESTNQNLNGTGASTGASTSVYFASTGSLEMKDVEIQGSVRGGHRAVDMYGGNGIFTNVKITSSYGAGIVIGSNTTAVLNNCDITVNGMYSAPYNSVCFGVWGGGEMTVNSGNYKMINDNTYATGDTHGGWVGIVMSSGGTLNVNGGTFTNVPAAGFNPAYERAIFELENNSPAVSTLNLNGGTFAPQKSQIYGGYGDRYYPTYNVANLVDNGNGTWSVIDLSESSVTLPSGVVLDLKGNEYDGTIVAEGDLTIKGDTKIKTLTATNGGTITIEDGKTLTLNNFSFGAKSNNTAEYTITGGTVEASYGFFQHGTYALYSDFETGYMYYSYGSDITVYGTFHSQGKGDGLDYVRGKLTIANGGKTIHDKSLWVGQPASWGAMNATLVVEEGGYVQANSFSVYDGSALQIDAENLSAGEVANIVCNSLSVAGTLEVLNNDDLTAKVNGNKIVLE